MAPINDMSFTEDIDEIEQSTVQRDRANLLTEYEKQQTVNTQRTSETTTRTSETTTRTSETTTRTSESETVFNVDNAILLRVVLIFLALDLCKKKNLISALSGI